MHLIFAAKNCEDIKLQFLRYPAISCSTHALAKPDFLVTGLMHVDSFWKFGNELWGQNDGKEPFERSFHNEKSKASDRSEILQRNAK